MVDLSKLPWGELRLPGGMTAAAKRHTNGYSYAIFSATHRAVAWKDDRGDHGWIIDTGPIDAVHMVLSATKLVDAFIKEHSKPKLPDVVPPEGMKWVAPDSVVGGKSTALIYEDRGCSVIVSVPTSSEKRDAMLACCEAADPGMTATVDVWQVGPTVAIESFVRRLGHGRYAVSFRRLP